ncbi:hypothetical protein, partial [Klebsiella pneumoniae]|uniref:hypothetical protein n=1 Tax=Klebsiella pneumoniae TaxID=573 RepID=UPI0030133C86
GGNGQAEPDRPQAPAADQENATVKAAVAVAHAVGKEIPPERKELAGSVLHYAYGTMIGAAYGVANEYSSLPRTGAGLAFGASLWL